MADLRAVKFEDAVSIGLASEKMTQAELARALGRTAGALSQTLSRGKPNLNTVLEICEALGAKIIIEFDEGQRVELIK